VELTFRAECRAAIVLMTGGGVCNSHLRRSIASSEESANNRRRSLLIQSMRTANGTLPDLLASTSDQAQVVSCGRVTILEGPFNLEYARAPANNLWHELVP